MPWRTHFPRIDAAGTFLHVVVAGQPCGLPVLAVRDVLRRPALTPVPLAPPDILGNLNLRGHIVTAVDVRKRLELPPAPPGTHRFAAVTEAEGEQYALVVDRVCDVVAADPARLNPLPATLADRWGGVATRLFRMETELMILLDIPSLLDLPSTPR